MNKLSTVTTSLLVFLFIVITVSQGFAQNLVIAGGGSLSDEIRLHLLSLSDKEQSNVLIIPQATAEDNWTARGEQQTEVFNSLGAEHVLALELDDREEAIRQIEWSDVIWMPGGSQQRLMNALVKAGVAEAVRQHVASGVPTGGTSAGAAIMSKKMIANSERDEKTGALLPVMSEGLGFWENAIIDQHFTERNRLERLEHAVEHHPGYFGIGIDEGTAVVFGGPQFKVIGEGTVTVVSNSGSGLNSQVLESGESFNTESFSGLEKQFRDEVFTLADKDIVQQALGFIKEYDEQTVANQIHIIEIPAPPFAEEKRAARYAEMMREFGLTDVQIDEEGNVLGRRAGRSGNRTIVFSAHLDTVFPEETDVTVTVRNDTLFAPGISDDGRGLTTVLTVLKTLQKLDMKTEEDILFVGTVGEEGLGDLRGVKYLFREGGPQIDAFISIDGSNGTRIVNQALGSHRYRITINGPGGHSWGAFGTANPAHALGRAIRHFDEMGSEYVTEGPRSSYNIGRIGGGTSINSVPFSNWMEVDMRSVDQNRLYEMDEILQSAVQLGVGEANEVRTRGDKLSADVEMIGKRPSGEIDPSIPFIQRAKAATEYFGNEYVLRRSSTDSNVPISLGIASMTLGGGGNSGGAHSLDEWWYNNEGHKGIQRAFLILLSEAKLAE
ncbi:hypothetical protein BH23BAC3_BH23BAC3_31880 [soil metagenome]